MVRNALPLLMLGAIVMAAGLVGCSIDQDPWFDSDLESAMATAGEEGTLVMVSFKTSWCSWCKRLDEDTFSDAAVRAELDELVALRLDAEAEGLEAAEKYGVRSFPATVFIDAQGQEIDRILGYLPPDIFLEEVRRIRAGDTFAACLRTFKEDPSSIEALERAVDGLLERSDPTGALERIETHRRLHGEEGAHAACGRLLFRTRSEMHRRLYRRAARSYRRDWPEIPVVPDSEGVAELHSLLADLNSVEDHEAALRLARKSDAAVVLNQVGTESTSGTDLVRVADFAFQAGQFDAARDLYLKWAGGREPGDDVDELNGVAWNLYLMRAEMEAATDLAREAYGADPSASVGDTLARLLYVRGSVEEAVKLQHEAAARAEGGMQEDLREAAHAMEAGEDLGDEPGFERFPGAKISG